MFEFEYLYKALLQWAQQIKILFLPYGATQRQQDRSSLSLQKMFPRGVKEMTALCSLKPGAFCCSIVPTTGWKNRMVWANPQKLQSLIASAATAKPHCILSDWQNLQKLQPLDASSALGNPQPPVSSPSAKPSSLQPPQCWECSSVPAPSLVSYVTCAAASPWISTAKSVEEKSLFLVRAQWGAPL